MSIPKQQPNNYSHFVVPFEKEGNFSVKNFPAYEPRNFIPVLQYSTPATVGEIKACLCPSSKIHITIIFPYTSRYKIPCHSAPPTKYLCIYLHPLTGPIHFTVFDLFTLTKIGVQFDIPFLSYVQILSSVFTLKQPQQFKAIWLVYVPAALTLESLHFAQGVYILFCKILKIKGDYFSTEQISTGVANAVTLCSL